MNGIRVSIFKTGGRSWSNGGISEFRDEATLILPEGGPSESTDDAPAIFIDSGNLPGTLKAIPADVQPGGRLGPMMGGCYVASSDSRFSEHCERVLGSRFYGAVPLHDRYESPSLYNFLST